MKIRRFIMILLIITIIIFGCSCSNRMKDASANADREVSASVRTEPQSTKQNNSGTQNDNKLSIVVSDTFYGVVGGYQNSRWLYGDEVAECIKGNEKYKMYSIDGIVGEAAGGMPYEDDQGTKQVDLEIKYFNKDSIQNSDKVNAASTVAVMADWDVLPRKLKKQNSYPDTYREIIAERLKSKKISTNAINIKSVIRVDLEGDGVEEALIVAQNDAIEDLINYADKDFFRNGDLFSIVLLRKIIDGKVENIFMGEVYLKKDEFQDTFVSSIAQFSIPCVLDVNGDGRMEIFIEDRHVLWGNLTCYEINGATFNEVFGASFET